MVDILIPTYEPDPLHLEAAIQCVLSQTDPEWTLLIHDDASIADVAGMVAPFLQDPRIRFEQSPVRLGIGGNWNACLQKGTAPYLQFLFQDDLWEPRYLETLRKTLEEHPSAGFASAEHLYACEDGMATADLYQEVHNFRKKHINDGLHRHEEFLYFWVEKELQPNMIGEPSFVMLRRSLVEKAGTFNESMPQFLDVEYWLRCLLVSDWVYVKQDLGSFRVHAGGASAQNEESGAGIYDRLECFEWLIHTLPAGYLRRNTVQARNEALVKMARKFLKRRRDGKNIPVKGNGKLKRFILKHPFLMAKALLRALVTPIAS